MSRSLLEVLRNVTLDPGEHAEFSADPARYLAQYGYEDVPAEDLSEAFSLVADTLPADVAQTVAPGLGAEAIEVDAAGFGAEGTQLVSNGFAAGPSLDADPTETTFGAVNGDFDEDADAELADMSELSELSDGLDGDPEDGFADDLDGDSTGTDPDDGADRPGGDDGGFGFGEGSEALNADQPDSAGVSALDETSIGSESTDGPDADDEGPELDYGEAAAEVGVGSAELGLDDADDFGTGLSDDDATDDADDFDTDDELDFGSSGEIDVDDIGAF